MNLSSQLIPIGHWAVLPLAPVEVRMERHFQREPRAASSLAGTSVGKRRAERVRGYETAAIASAVGNTKNENQARAEML